MPGFEDTIVVSLDAQVDTPVHVSRLRSVLASHPDRDLVNHVLRGLTYGFDIGVEGALGPGSRSNNFSALKNKELVSVALQQEIRNRCISGPYVVPPLVNFHCSPITAVAKPNKSVRLILDMSAPRGDALNEFIDPDKFSCHYSSFDTAVDMIVGIGKGAFMCKLDLKNAFRLCPVRQQDWHLLGFRWEGQFYFYVRLPYGSRSSPHIFNNLADLLCWVFTAVCGIPSSEHYLDDYLLAAQTHSVCSQFLLKATDMCGFLGVPLSSEKIVGPATSLTYLGIKIDSVLFTVSLPQEKLDKLKLSVHAWHRKSSCTKKELLSLIGFLSFACKVVRPGRIFLRRLIDLSTLGVSLSSTIVVTDEAQLDILWWRDFIDDWNGREMILARSCTSAELSFYTDASTLGMGAVFGSHWFMHPWPASYALKHINILELLAIAAALLTWGVHYSDLDLVVFTDNKPITQIWLSGTTKDRDIMKIIRYLFFFLAKRNLNVRLQHIYGYSNSHADSLSRLQVHTVKNSRFDDTPTVVPTDVWRILDA